jgi:multidrug efflux pump subunit AcrA (membrane-fusion protein)
MPEILNGKAVDTSYENEQQEVDSRTVTKLPDDWSEQTKDLIDSFPKIWTRGMLYLLIMFASIALPWAMLFKIDEIGTARGRLEPQGKIFKLDSVASGTVASILVKEGEIVKLGQPLVILNSELVESELRLELQKLQGLSNRRLQLNPLNNQIIKYLKASTLESEIEDSQSKIQSLKLQLQQKTLKSPTAGQVFQLSIQSPGTLIQAGTMVAEIAPEQSNLIVRAQMPISESGSLRKGLPVKLKFDAYPFQSYGIIEGELLKISPTSTEKETPDGKLTVYNLEIAMKQNCIKNESKCISLRPGDTTTAEVIIRQRRIIDSILDPFKQLQQHK